MGTLNIIDWCVENGNPSPTWDDQSGSVFVSFFPAVLFDDRQGGEDVDVKEGDQVGTMSGLSREQAQILNILSEERFVKVLMAEVGRTNRTKFRDQVLNPLIKNKLVEMTIPDKPRSSKQKYRLTNKGREVLKGKIS